MEEEFGEGMLSPQVGEGGLTSPTAISRFIIEEPIKEKKLTFDEASKCLNTLGKDESGVRYAYLMITATARKLTDISIILNFKHVLFIDLSDNFLNLDALQVLSGMPFLLYLKVERNKVESAALEPMYYLQCLNLNMNQVTETCDINQPQLETLELQDNLIYTIQFDSERLSNLKMLNLRGNQLIDFSGTYPSSLEKLYMNQNKISKIVVDFSKLTNLKILHLRDNQIKKLNGFSDQLPNLTYLNLRNNKINKLREFRKLQCLPKLDTLIILENPVCGTKELQVPGEGDEEVDEEEMFGEDQFVSKDPTRIPIIVLLPDLKRLNKDAVTFEEKEEAELRKKNILEQIFDELSSEEETELPTTTEFTTDYTTDTEAGAYTRGSVTADDEDDEVLKKGTPVTETEDPSNTEATDENTTGAPTEESQWTSGVSGNLSAMPTENPLGLIKEDVDGENKEN
ncbi:leucine-rich repeat-containing protein 23-like [Anoplophora glabripennis]|uniref:leucine-rich repeat-containing protein 23-like n=1 Tax=Anoplophora glabripennis TaxID=217634 RepID=UPI000873DFC9|nr:leucine-rich repeat-containing protein 23-like [Anoplophora glabripennis]